MKKLILAGALAAATLASPAVALAGQPAGQGANACHQIYEATTTDDGNDQVLEAVKINVGNPDEVLIAGDCDGGAISYVDDGLSLTVSSPSGKDGGSVTQPFHPGCGVGPNTGGPAVDVTDLFSPGTNSVQLTITNECGGVAEAPDLFLVVTQHAD